MCLVCVGSLACDACTSGSGGLRFGVGGLWVGPGTAGGSWSLCPPSLMSNFLPVLLVMQITAGPK